MILWSISIYFVLYIFFSYGCQTTIGVIVTIIFLYSSSFEVLALLIVRVSLIMYSMCSLITSWVCLYKFIYMAIGKSLLMYVLLKKLQVLRTLKFNTCIRHFAAVFHIAFIDYWWWQWSSSKIYLSILSRYLMAT